MRRAAIAFTGALTFFAFASAATADVINDSTMLFGGGELSPMPNNMEIPATDVDWADVRGKPLTFPSDWSQVANKPATASRWPTWNEVNGRPATFPSDWSQVANKPSVYPTTWGAVAGKPASFPPDEDAVKGMVAASAVVAGYPNSVRCGDAVFHIAAYNLKSPGIARRVVRYFNHLSGKAADFDVVNGQGRFIASDDIGLRSTDGAAYQDCVGTKTLGDLAAEGKTDLPFNPPDDDPCLGVDICISM